MIIAIDIDDTIAEYASEIIKLLQERYGVTMTRAQWTNFDLEDSPGFAHLRTQIHTCMSIIMNEGIMRTLKPYPGVLVALKNIGEHHQIIFITARGSGRGDWHLAKKHTLSWLQKNNIAFQGLYFAEHSKKHLIAQELNADLLIEDNGAIANAAAHLGMKVILMDQPYNSDITNSLIIRVTNWKDIEKYIRENSVIAHH